MHEIFLLNRVKLLLQNLMPKRNNVNMAIHKVYTFISYGYCHADKKGFLKMNYVYLKRI